MSGSSLDGLDIVHCFFEITSEPSFQINSWQITCAETIGFDNELIKHLKTATNLTAKSLIKLDHDFGRILGELTQNFIDKNELDPDFISSHGHTVFHNPKEGFSLQIGHPVEIVAKTGLPVIGDFRSTDIALGGQGAPFAPIVDLLLFSEYDVMVNLGGIMNASFLKSDGQIIAYDLAPCNQTLNHLAQLEGKLFDDQGQIASNGKTNDDLMLKLQNWEFFKKNGPKSLDNSEIKKDFHTILNEFVIPTADKMHTTVELIAVKLKESIEAQNYINHPKILLTGGGAFNKYLVERFRMHLPDAEFIVPSETIISFKEGLLMALMGLLRINNQPNVLKSVTGCNKDHIAGAVYQGTKKYINEYHR